MSATDSEGCRHCRERFSEFIDGVLAHDEMRAVEEHVGVCAECRRELELWRRTVEAVSRLPRKSAPAHLTDAVMDRARAEQRPVLSPRRKSRIIRLAPRLVAAAAVVLVAVGLITLTYFGTQERRAPARVAMLEERVGDEVAEEAAMKKDAAGAAVGAVSGAVSSLADRDEPEDMKLKSGLKAGAGAVPSPGARASAAAERLRRAREKHAAGLEVTALDSRVEAGDRFAWRGVAPQQVLTLMTADISAVATRASKIAGKFGVATTRRHDEIKELGWKEVKAELVMRIPADRYDEVVQQLALLAPPQNQKLANTPSATGGFFNGVLQDYEAARRKRTLVARRYRRGGAVVRLDAAGEGGEVRKTAAEPPLLSKAKEAKDEEREKVPVEAEAAKDAKGKELAETEEDVKKVTAAQPELDEVAGRPASARLRAAKRRVEKAEVAKRSLAVSDVRLGKEVAEPVAVPAKKPIRMVLLLVRIVPLPPPEKPVKPQK